MTQSSKLSLYFDETFTKVYGFDRKASNKNLTNNAKSTRAHSMINKVTSNS